ncbi:MAG: HxsD-like protein [Polyangiaceae bacterium]
MIELRFHKELYDGKSIDAAVKTYGEYGTFELVEQSHGWIVNVTGNDPESEQTLALELSNYALGLTIESTRTG